MYIPKRVLVVFGLIALAIALLAVHWYAPAYFAWVLVALGVIGAFIAASWLIIAASGGALALLVFLIIIAMIANKNSR